MPENRFYIDQPLVVGEEVTLIDKEAHHLSVLRKKPQESVELINGRNQLAEATILSQGKKVRLLIEKVVEGKKREREFILCQALCEPSRLDLILEKTTELGVHEIWLFPAERSQKKEVNDHQIERMEAILIAAMKQCGRLDLSKLQIKPPLKQMAALEGHAFFGDLSPSAPPFYPLLQNHKRVLFFNGPPSGFSEAEIALLRNLGAQGVSLNPQVLRTETAAIAATTLALHVM